MVTTEYHVKQSRGFMPMGDITSGSQAPANGAQQSNDSTPTPQHDAPTSRPKGQFLGIHLPEVDLLRQRPRVALPVRCG